MVKIRTAMWTFTGSSLSYKGWVMEQKDAVCCMGKAVLYILYLEAYASSIVHRWLGPVNVFDTATATTTTTGTTSWLGVRVHMTSNSIS